MTRTQNLLVELLVEELPPKALKTLGEAFAGVLFERLKALGLATSGSEVSWFATPRRLAAHVTAVVEQAAGKAVSLKLMPSSVGFDLSRQPTAALLKRMKSFGFELTAVQELVLAIRDTPMQQLRDAMEDASSSVEKLFEMVEGKTKFIGFTRPVSGLRVAEGLQEALLEAIDKLPIPKVMTYQMTDGWSDVKFVRPAHRLVALHGSTVVGVKALGLQAGNMTEGHRFESPVKAFAIASADSYESQLLEQGAVIASFATRRAEIARQLASAAASVGGGAAAIEDRELLDEVTALVERPNVLVCEFEPEFLEVPQECLILTMKANQKYFPLLDARGKLTHKFLVVSSIRPDNPSAVISGNERVIRPRLADAKFFFDQDRKTTLASRVQALDKVVYHNKLGSQGDRVERVRAIARAIAGKLGDAALVLHVDQAAQLAKTDLVTDMVGEFPELQGVMGRYYALHDGLAMDVADAIEDHYKPRFAGDGLPRGEVGVIVALADKLETLVGMFGSGNLPTGDKDPFALRRHALGVVRLLVEKDLALDLHELLVLVEGLIDVALAEKGIDNSQTVLTATGQPIKGLKHRTVRSVAPLTAEFLLNFIHERFAGSLREQGNSAQEVDSVLALWPQRLGEVPKRLAAVRAFAAVPEAPALAAANKRIGNILKKAERADAHVSEVLLREDAEKVLYAAMRTLVPRADAQFNAGDYTASLQTLAALRGPVDAFFDGVMVNAQEADLRLNRLGLLATLHRAMNRVADLSRLAS